MENVSTQVVPLQSDWFVGHESAQSGMPSVRQPNMQDIDMAVVQAPAPSQCAAVVAIEEVQLAAAPQDTVLAG